MSEVNHTLFGALALELAPGSDAGRDRLPQASAGELARLIALDLAAFVPEAAGLELATVGAHYDPVELLRPRWPIHHELDELAARAPHPAGDGIAHGIGAGRIIAFGSHDGQLPGALAPSRDHLGGPLRLLPWSLRGDAGITRDVDERFEAELMETGMAGAATALLAQEAFGLRIEHARYLTLHDLCALMAMQYEHSGLQPLWPVLEAALLAPGRDVWLDAPPEPLIHFSDGETRIALFSPDGWRRRYALDIDDDARLERGFGYFEARQRQFAALLMAHGIPVTFAHCGGDPVDEL